MIRSASQECFSMSIIERRRMFSSGLYCVMTILTLSAGMQPATARALIGAAAPAFTLTDSNGRNLSLADFEGKTVVLEWTNHECPYVGKHYRSGNMQALQKDAAAKGFVWLTIISSMPDSQGYVSAAQANDLTRARNAAPVAVLLDPDGVIGRAYDARVTPHMFIIDPKGTLLYMGGIDSIRSTSLDD